MLAGKAVIVNWSDVAVAHRPAYYEWHSREHMVGRVALPPPDDSVLPMCRVRPVPPVTNQPPQRAANGLR